MFQCRQLADVPGQQPRDPMIAATDHRVRRHPPRSALAATIAGSFAGHRSTLAGDRHQSLSVIPHRASATPGMPQLVRTLLKSDLQDHLPHAIFQLFGLLLQRQGFGCFELIVQTGHFPTINAYDNLDIHGYPLLTTPTTIQRMHPFATKEPPGSVLLKGIPAARKLNSVRISDGSVSWTSVSRTGHKARIP